MNEHKNNSRYFLIVWAIKGNTSTHFNEQHCKKQQLRTYINKADTQ